MILLDILELCLQEKPEEMALVYLVQSEGSAMAGVFPARKDALIKCSELNCLVPVGATCLVILKVIILLT